MVAVARLVRRVLDDGVDGRLLDDARGIASRTAELGLETAARAGGGRGGRQQHHQHHGGGGGGVDATSHRVLTRLWWCESAVVRVGGGAVRRRGGHGRPSNRVRYIYYSKRSTRIYDTGDVDDDRFDVI